MMQSVTIRLVPVRARLVGLVLIATTEYAMSINMVRAVMRRAIVKLPIQKCAILGQASALATQAGVVRCAIDRVRY